MFVSVRLLLVSFLCLSSETEVEVREEREERDWHAAGFTESYVGNLVDSASSHTLVSKIKPCMSKYKRLYSETANGSLYQS